MMWAPLALLGALAVQSTGGATVTGPTGASIPRSWIPYDSSRQNFPQCCHKDGEDGEGCHMVRVSQALHDATPDSPVSMEFRTKSGDILLSKISGDSENAGRLLGSFTKSGDNYCIVPPNGVEKADATCGTKHSPNLYYKLVNATGLDNFPGSCFSGASMSEDTDTDETPDKSDEAAGEGVEPSDPVVTGPPAVWSEWGAWSELSQDNLERTRSRNCENGDSCTGDSQGREKYEWSLCDDVEEHRERTLTCSTGICDDPISESQYCVLEPFSDWTDCKGTNASESSRERAPCEFLLNEELCPGNNMTCFCENEGEVETGACTLVGTAGEWEAWTACSILTGGASRTRACLGPPGSEGDNRPVVCEDLPAEERECPATQLECAVSGFIYSAGYINETHGSYGNSTDDVFPITVADHQIIDIEILDLDLEYSPDCKYDYVKIVDKSTGHDLLGKMCGQEKREVRTSTQSAEVVFHSDKSVSERGFKLKWCAPQLVTSPDYPSVYPANQYYSQKIVVEQGKRIRFQVLALNIEYSEGCVYDYVSITDSNGDQILDKTCGQEGPATLYSTTNVAYVEFKSDEFNQKGGFEFHWVQVNSPDDAPIPFYRDDESGSVHYDNDDILRAIQ